MRCEDLRDKLDAYASGELPQDQRGEVALHLKSCGQCQGALDRLRRLALVLGQAQTPPVPANFADRVMDRARARRASLHTTASWNPLQWWRGASLAARTAAAATLALALVSGLAVGWNTAQSPRRGNAGQLASKADPLGGYSHDYLGDAPDGSLAASYLSLVAGRGGEGR